MLRRINEQSFDWLTWRANSIHSLGLKCRYYDITSERGKRTLKKYVVGYCKGESLLCRPKENEIALMCFKEGEHFWFHIRKKEFDEVFGCIT